MILSKIRPLLTQQSTSLIKRSMSGHHNFPLEPSRWQWRRFKDIFHFYVMLGVIPCGLATLCANIFVGPATLSEIPEGYTPKYYEYYSSPVTRFIARYIVTNPQQDYEKFCAYIFMEHERKQLREIEAQVKAKMQEREDYQAYYYRPVLAKYHRVSKEASDYMETIRGD